jgi:hypothetical protein
MAELIKERATLLCDGTWETPPEGSSEQFIIQVAPTCSHYSSNQLNIKKHWTPPPELVSEITKATGETTERAL